MGRLWTHRAWMRGASSPKHFLKDAVVVELTGCQAGIPAALTGDLLQEDGGKVILIDESALAGLCQRHGVQSLRLFGSAARGEDRPDSDLDVLVRFGETKSLIEIVRIERDFEEYFGRPVDLVTEGELSPYIRDEVLAQASPLYSPGG